MAERNNQVFGKVNTDGLNLCLTGASDKVLRGQRMHSGCTWNLLVELSNESEVHSMPMKFIMLRILGRQIYNSVSPAE
jgi:hypothetical protein